MTILSYDSSIGLLDLATMLGLKKTRIGFVGACPVCGYKSGFSLTEKNSKLLAYCHINQCSFAEVMEEVKRLSGYSAISATPAIEPLNQPFLVSNSAKSCYQNTGYLDSLWNQSVSAEGSIVETYLGSRSISIEVPSTIRLLVDALHKPSGLRMPVMLAKVVSSENALVGLHRTYLSSDGFSKANVDPPKMMLGKCSGGSVHLAEPSNKLALAEGLETALSVQQMTGIPTWATLSAGGMRALKVPFFVEEVIIFADHDQVGIKAAYEKASMLAGMGKKVSVVKPVKVNTDFNDFLLEGA